MKYCVTVGVLAAALLGLSVARGQAPTYPAAATAAPPVIGSSAPPTINAPPIATAPATGVGAVPPSAAAADANPAGVNDYLTYRRPGACCGPLGLYGGISTEMFMRPGISFPIGGSILGRALAPGFMIQGGGRSLFFNRAQDLAWTVELGISSTWNDANRDITAFLSGVQRPVLQFAGNNQTAQANDANGNPLVDTIAALPLTTSSVNETYVHLAIGHEIYLLGFADVSDDGCKWRLGWDVGGRWGSAKLVYMEGSGTNIPLSQAAIDEFDRANPFGGTPLPGPVPFKHRTDVVGGPCLALHTDFEVPFKSCVFFGGVRTELSYIFADLLQQQNNTDLMTVNLLFNLGCRF